jgi:hypothetical protein
MSRQADETHLNMRNMSEMWLSYSKSCTICTCITFFSSIRHATLNNHSAWPGRNMYAQTETVHAKAGMNAEQHCLTEVQAQHKRHSYSYIHAGKNSTAWQRFPVLTGNKYSTESTVINAEPGKESTALMREVLLRCQASTPQIGTPILACTMAHGQGQHSLTDVSCTDRQILYLT